VREVGREHDAVDAHVMPQLDATRSTCCRLNEMCRRTYRWAAAERLDVQQALGPVAVALVPVVGLLHPERNPASRDSAKKMCSAGSRSNTPDMTSWARLMRAGC